MNSDTTSASAVIGSKSAWQNGAPSWITGDFDNSTCTTTETAHNTNLAVVVWRPKSLNGSNDIVSFANIGPTDGSNHTGGYVYDGTNYYRNAMAYSGRPTHYFDFTTSSWVPFTRNHEFSPGNAFPLCVWKAKEYAWHARASGVTIYTVGYGSHVNATEQVLLAQIANATNSTAYSTNIIFNSKQPIGQLNSRPTPRPTSSNDFYQIGTAINAALTQ